MQLSSNAPLLINGSSLPVTSTLSSAQKKCQQGTMPGYIIFVAIFRRKQRIILFGSPANKAGLQVGDRIVEMNGYSIEGKDYAHIVGLIHQCGKEETDIEGKS
uniref:PDZ domain-containing protein n=1 Tax=Elaeophora elaphi TaxID=1147741 RepID=A0A0R3RV54_9BILA